MSDITKEEAFAFAEWLGEGYVRLHKVWVHKYVDQLNETNWHSTEALYSFWKYINSTQTE